MLAQRGLNRFLLHEVQNILSAPEQAFISPFLRQRIPDNAPRSLTGTYFEPPFEIRPNVSIHMFSTEAPCGDASMEILVSEKADDSEPWENVPKDIDALQGRGYFSFLGKVRRKPSRGDAEPTLSKSCTDKLALRQFTSLLSCATSLVIAPTDNAYLRELIVPADKYSEEGYARAFGASGRLSVVQSISFPSPFRFHPFKFTTIPQSFGQFKFAKPSPGEPRGKAGNISALFIKNLNAPEESIFESLLGGVKQGYRPFASDARKSSLVSRKRMSELVTSLCNLIEKGECSLAGQRQPPVQAKGAMTYEELKFGVWMAARGATKDLVIGYLGPWPRNGADQNWSL